MKVMWSICVLIFVVLLSQAVSVNGASDLHPNLQALPAKDLQLEFRSDGRVFVRFSATSVNLGIGALELVAGEIDHGQGNQKVYQRIYRTDGTYYDLLAGSFVFHDGHNHFHFEEFALYTLQLADAPGASKRTSNKTTFCVIDTDLIDPLLPGAPAEPVYVNCDDQKHGLSVGWGDTYGYWLPGQEIDVTDLPDGEYNLSIEVDPKNRLVEINEDDNISTILISLIITDGIVLTGGDVQVLLSEDFENGAPGWSTTGLWHPTAQRYNSQSTSEAYNNDVDYNTGVANSGGLVSPPIDLTQGEEAIMTFNHWYETEELNSYDLKQVQVSTDAGLTWQTLLQLDSTNSEMLVWQKEVVDLSSYLGQTIQLRFLFDTIDALYNNFEGWYVDDVTVYVSSSAPNNKPIANAGEPYSGDEDQLISFNGSGSSDPDGDPLTYDWDFGDGTIITGTTPNPTHVYTAGGTYQVTLIVNDGIEDSLPSSTTATISEVNDPPVADVGPDQSGSIGENLTFDGSGSSDIDGTIDSYGWDFGDGNSASGQVVTHSYSTDGNFTVTLTVTDNGGLSDQDSANVNIFAEDIVNITTAQYNSAKKELSVEATSSQSSQAVLTVEGFGTMNYNARKNIYKLTANGVPTKPDTVTVNSSFGGSDTSPVTTKSRGKKK